MIKLDVTKNKTLSFELDVEGTDQSASQVQLVFEGNEKGNLVLAGTMEGSKVTVEIMSESIQAYQAIFPEQETIISRLNVVIEENVFTPWEGEFELIKPVDVKLKEAKTNVKKKVVAKIVENIDEAPKVIAEKVTPEAPKSKKAKLTEYML